MESRAEVPKGQRQMRVANHAAAVVAVRSAGVQGRRITACPEVPADVVAGQGRVVGNCKEVPLGPLVARGDWD